MEECCRRDGKLFGQDLNQAGKEVGTGGEEIMPDNIVREGLQDGGLEGGEGLFTESCGHGVSEGRRI